MIMALDREGSALLRLLIAHLSSIDHTDPSTFITYAEAHSALRLPMLGATVGISLQMQGLNSLAGWLHANGLPALSGLIVNADTRAPGKGFFSSYGKDDTDFAWWLGEIEKAKNFDWNSRTANPGSDAAAGSAASADSSAGVLRLRDLASAETKLFLKSEYGPLSDSWPVVAFSPPALKTRLQKDYRASSDFIVYTGTSGEDTLDEAHRGRLLSVVRIDKSKTFETSTVIPKKSWDWANRDHPGKWTYAFKVLQGWEIVDFPKTKTVAPNAYSKMGQYPHRGMVYEVTGEEREALLDLKIEPLHLTNVSQTDNTFTLNELLQQPDLNAEANRIAGLIFNRVNASGSLVERRAPERNAPTDLLLQVAALLKARPLTCALCGGAMQIRPSNRLLQPSPDRIESDSGDYGPKNFQLAHLACNLGKNNASVAQFEEWLNVAFEGYGSLPPQEVFGVGERES
jgi:hypothetical protein